MIKLIDVLLSAIFPLQCTGCGKFGSYVCSLCIKSLQFSRPICPVCAKPALDGQTHPRCHTRYTIDGLVSIYRNTGPIKQCIKRLKYRKTRQIAPFLAQLTVPLLDKNPCFKRFLEDATPTIIPIPIHWWRGRRRSFNQSELLGVEVGRMMHLEIESKFLVRERYTKPQVSLMRKERLVNTKGTFAVRQIADHTLPASIILLDDVWTTGATMREAANTLKRAGVKEVWGVTVAR